MKLSQFPNLPVGFGVVLVDWWYCDKWWIPGVVGFGTHCGSETQLDHPSSRVIVSELDRFGADGERNIELEISVSCEFRGQFCEVVAADGLVAIRQLFPGEAADGLWHQPSRFFEVDNCIAVIFQLLQSDSLQKSTRPFQRAGFFDLLQFLEGFLRHTEIQKAISSDESANSLGGESGTHC